MSKLDNVANNLAWLLDNYGAKREIAEAAGVSPHYLSDICRKVSVPSLEIAYRLSDAVGIGLDSLSLLPSKFQKMYEKLDVGEKSSRKRQRSQKRRAR